MYIQQKNFIPDSGSDPDRDFFREIFTGIFVRGKIFLRVCGLVGEGGTPIPSIVVAAVDENVG
jgi:hypothetical protein